MLETLTEVIVMPQMLLYEWKINFLKVIFTKPCLLLFNFLELMYVEGGPQEKNYLRRRTFLSFTLI